MTKKELLNSAKNIEEAAKALLEKASALRTDAGSALQAAKRLENQLQAKEREAELERARIEKEAELKRELAEKAAIEERARAEREAMEERARAEKEAMEERARAEKEAMEERTRAEKEAAEAAKKAAEREKAAVKAETGADNKSDAGEAKENENTNSDRETRGGTKSFAGTGRKTDERNVKRKNDIPENRYTEQKERSASGYRRSGEARQNAGISLKQSGERGSREKAGFGSGQGERGKSETGSYRERTGGGQNSDRDQSSGKARQQTSHYQQRKSDSGGREIHSQENKGTYVRTFDIEKKGKNKKTIMKETAPSSKNWEDEGRNYSARRKKQVKAAEQRRIEPIIIEKAVITTEFITIRDFSEKIGKPASEIIKKLFMMGIVANINQEIDFDTCQLVAMDYDIELEQQLAKTFEETMQASAEEADTEENLAPRPPVVTIMGHVDHGKTSLLDAIRNSSVTSGEAGGITQHIGAYTVKCNNRMITFIDTPGHEAFTAMRARGAQVTDVVILVVAADDGIMPQTVEAINHSKAANVPIIVAINKIDKPEADPERVKKQLTEYGLLCEDWGGDVICVPISAKKQMNLDSLLEMVLLQADILELRANPCRAAKGTVIESKLDKGRGPVATVLVQNGTLKVGDPIVAGMVYGKVRAMTDDRGRTVKSAGPSQPVEVLGFNEVPEAGDIMNVAEVSKKVAEERRTKLKVEQMKTLSKANLDDLFGNIKEGEIKTLNIIVKADVHGSVEAVTQALEKLSNEEVRVKCIHGGVGGINESDIMFASASNAVVIGFNVRPDSSARALAEQEKVDVRTYRVIYQAIEDVENAIKGMFKPVFRETQLGTVSVRNIFKISGVGVIAGCYVQEGKAERNSLARVVRDGIVIHEGKISSLRRFKDDVKEVAAGYECGIGIENFNDLRENDVIEAYIMEEVKR